MSLTDQEDADLRPPPPPPPPRLIPPPPPPPPPCHIPPPPPFENVQPDLPQRQPPAAPAATQQQQPAQPQQPRQEEQGGHQAQQEPQRQEEQQEDQWEQQQQWQQQRQRPKDWTLHLAVDIPASATHPAENNQHHHQNNNNNYMILRIHVAADMDATMLSRCIQQACAGVWLVEQQGSSSISRGFFGGGGGNDGNNTIVGLFAQESRIFVSLHHLLQQASTINNNNNNRHWQKQVYWLRLPPIPVAPPKAIPCYRLHAPLLLGILTIGVVSALVQEHGDTVQKSLVLLTMFVHDAVLDTAKSLHYNLIEWPLQDLYRNGPWFVGWEGDDLSRICARITFHGDASFWSMNTAECFRIYQGKLQAFLRLARPALITFLVLVVVFLLRLLWWEVQRHSFLRKQRQQQQYRAPPADMVETYQAFQTLLRQVQRTLAPTTPTQNGNANDHQNQPQRGQRR